MLAHLGGVPHALRPPARESCCWCVFSGLKLLETRTHRDAAVAAFLAYFLVITNFLYTQSILTAALMACVAARHHRDAGRLQPRRSAQPRANLRTAGVLLAQAVPAALVLFLLFPRVQGPLWGLPQDAYAGMTGLSESMSPGNLSQPRAVRRDRLPRRVRRRSAAACAALLARPGAVGFRRPHLDHGAGLRGVPPPPRRAGERYRYAVVLEPHNRAWLFALETAASVPERARMTFDGQILASTPVRTRLRYELTSVIAARAARRTEVRGALARALRLPPSFNPRAQRARRAVADAARRATTRSSRARSSSCAPAASPTRSSRRCSACTRWTSSCSIRARASASTSPRPSRSSCAPPACRRASSPATRAATSTPYDRIVTVRQSDAHAWARCSSPGAAGCASTRPRRRCRGASSRVSRAPCPERVAAADDAAAHGVAARRCATAGRRSPTSGTSGCSATTPSGSAT